MIAPTGCMQITEVRNENTRDIEGYDYEWYGGDVTRLDYPSVIYWEPASEVDYDLPLGVGSRVRIGPFRLRVLEEEPWRASVLVIRERGLLTDLRVAWHRASRGLAVAFSRFVLTLWVWGLADHEEGTVPTWRDIHALRWLAERERARKQERIKETVERINEELADA